MKKLLAMICVLALTGCAIQPLPVGSMRASDEVYHQIEKDFYLRHSLGVSPVKLEIPPKALNSTFYTDLYANSTEALSASLNKAGLLAKSTNARYTLETTVLDVQDPRCFFGVCETGSTIKYQLKRGDLVAYEEMLVVPQNYDYPAFGANMHFVVRDAMGWALGNNFAHLIHVLSTKTEGDLK